MLFPRTSPGMWKVAQIGDFYLPQNGKNVAEVNLRTSLLQVGGKNTCLWYLTLSVESLLVHNIVTSNENNTLTDIY